ncbi:hypothetical protein FNF28_06435 [Cafeteria roenbergensis]|uniref:IBB domain-containing protein n=1 Tax=Cafeteria roenbergensis TaxID=33653 RepID=A0A5A8CXZ1_CAFRO|nr:hypothetical protein FNF28_06435 [Cafeteria roenbergensis]
MDARDSARERAANFHKGLGGRKAFRDRQGKIARDQAVRRRGAAAMQKRRLASIPVHDAAAPASPGSPAPSTAESAGGISSHAQLAATIATAMDPGTPARGRLGALSCLREAATDESVPASAWLPAGLVGLVTTYLAEAETAQAAAAHQRHRHACVWLLVELTAPDDPATAGLATELVSSLGPLIVPLLDGADTVMAELVAHALANFMACSPALPAALAKMGAGGALGRQLCRMPSTVAGACMWATRQLLSPADVSHEAVVHQALPALRFWFDKAARGQADADADADTGTGTGTGSGTGGAGGGGACGAGGGDGAGPGAGKGSAGIRWAVVEAAVLASSVAARAQEAWLPLRSAEGGVIPALCGALRRPSLHPQVRAPLLEALASITGCVDVGAAVLSTDGFAAGLVAMAAVNAPELDTAGRPTGRGLSEAVIADMARRPLDSAVGADAGDTTVPHLSMLVAANIVSPPSPEAVDSLAFRSRALAAAGVAASLPRPEEVLGPLPGAPPPSELARCLLSAGMGQVCVRWLHSSWRMAHSALLLLAALSRAPPHHLGAPDAATAVAPPPHLGPVVSLPGVLPALLRAVREHASLESAGSALGVLRQCLEVLPSGFKEAMEAAGGREALDALGYSGRCAGGGSVGMGGGYDPWVALGAQARAIADRFFEEDDDEDDEDDEEEGAGAFAGAPLAAAAFGAPAASPAAAGVGRGRGRALALPSWATATAGSVAGHSAAAAPHFG